LLVLVANWIYLRIEISFLAVLSRGLVFQALDHFLTVSCNGCVDSYIGDFTETDPQQTRDAKILRRSVLQQFQTLPDPRGERTQHHSLVTIALFAVLAGTDGFVAIERYGKGKQSWLETFLDLLHGIPSHNTFGRVMGSLDPEALETGFLTWVGRITEVLGRR
jgi:hypothetical protein